jgi:hypothetical protein
MRLPSAPTRRLIDPCQVEDRVETLVSQRILGLALACEDLNDHDERRHEPTFAMLAEIWFARPRLSSFGIVPDPSVVSSGSIASVRPRPVNLRLQPT